MFVEDDSSNGVVSSLSWGIGLLIYIHGRCQTLASISSWCISIRLLGVFICLLLDIPFYDFFFTRCCQYLPGCCSQRKRLALDLINSLQVIWPPPVSSLHHSAAESCNFDFRSMKLDDLHHLLIKVAKLGLMILWFIDVCECLPKCNWSIQHFIFSHYQDDVVINSRRKGN